MKIKDNDSFRIDYKGYMEPVLLKACEHQAKQCGAKTRSKYIRYAVIRALIEDGYPLNRLTKKFDKFYQKQNQ